MKVTGEAFFIQKEKKSRRGKMSQASKLSGKKGLPWDNCG